MGAGQGGVERKRCIYCTRPIAVEIDWVRNGELPSDREDEEAERQGLNGLCWEPGQDSCETYAEGIGRPVTLLEALERLDKLAAPPHQGEGTGG